MFKHPKAATLCRIAFACSVVIASACVAVPYDDGPPGPGPAYYGYGGPAVYPWYGGVDIDIAHGYGRGGGWGHGGGYRGGGRH